MTKTRVRARLMLVGVLTAAAIALAGCATGVEPMADNAPTSMETPAASEPMAEESPDAMAGEPSATETAEPMAPAEGAYVDYEDGIIAETAGPKALFFHATWCPKCRALDDELRADGAPDGLTVFKVDFDDRTDLRQQYGVTLQTTIVFVDDDGEMISSVVLYDDPSVASLEAAMP
ncbi:thioredoxin family protein [Microbacterium sp. 2FI]|uniref:thioredoxin family protein n=1 Tax=Microbacterium sp. 2FI TaxID=2502193 RepID=UPI0010F83BF0|nr:thioredoxin family protein [Microbacterium sp. 2FI]